MIEWNNSVKSSEIRCPYCVVDGNFRLMTRQSGGDWYFCEDCGHLALPSSPFYHCTCGKCASLYSAVQTQSPVKKIQSGLRRLFSAEKQKIDGERSNRPRSGY